MMFVFELKQRHSCMQRLKQQCYSYKHTVLILYDVVFKAPFLLTTSLTTPAALSGLMRGLFLFATCGAHVIHFDWCGVNIQM